VGVLVVAGVVAAVLIPATGRATADPQRADDASLQLAVADAGGLDGLGVATDASTGSTGATPSTAPGAKADRPGVRGLAARKLGSDTLLVGTVGAAGGGSLNVNQDGGGSVKVTTDDNTKVRGSDKHAVSDLAAGQRVVVRVDTAKHAVGVLILRPHVAGTVTALDGDRATVTRASGQTQIVDVSGLSAKPKVGDLIAVVGSLTDNGTTVKADMIRQLPKTS
jgi:hypothetical protein